jgi:hypothetical protein
VEEGKDALKKKGRVFVKFFGLTVKPRNIRIPRAASWVRNLSEFSYVLREASLIDVYKLYILFLNWGTYFKI